MTNDKALSRVLFLVAAEGASPEPWLSDVRREADGMVELQVASTECAADFAGVTTVIDVGGWASNDAIDRGADAGVRLWQVLGYGLDHIDVAHVLERKMLLAHTPGAASAVALAEHAMLLMLLVEKKISECATSLIEGKVGSPLVGELYGQDLLLIGYGASGRELAKRAIAFGMRVSAVDLTAPDDPLLQRSGDIAELKVMVQDADVVSLHLPLTDATEHLVDAEFVSWMRPSSVLINVARGKLVDEVALIAGLRAGKVRGAGLDVFEIEPLGADHPFHTLNVALTPHVAGMTVSTSRRRAAIAINNAVLVAAEQTPNFEVTTVPSSAASSREVG